jgi:hypothetical protein
MLLQDQSGGEETEGGTDTGGEARGEVEAGTIEGRSAADEHAESSAVTDVIYARSQATVIVGHHAAY